MEKGKWLAALSVVVPMILPAAAAVASAPWSEPHPNYNVPYTIDDGRSGECILRVAGERCHRRGTSLSDPRNAIWVRQLPGVMYSDFTMAYSPARPCLGLPHYARVWAIVGKVGGI